MHFIKTTKYTHTMKIHQDIKGRNRYCGPAAIAYATGFSTDDAASFEEAELERARLFCSR